MTIDNYYEIFSGILNPKHLEGLRLLLTPFPQQQFNQTEDRRSERPSRGVACFDCHANGHTNAATHLAGDIRPQEYRHRIETPSLRGVNVQRLFGSQRALKIGGGFHRVRAACGLFRRRPRSPPRRRGSTFSNAAARSTFMAEFQEMLDFPPAPSLTSMASSIRPRRRRPRCADKRSSSARANARRATRRRPLHRQQHAQLADGALLQDADDQRLFAMETARSRPSRCEE